MSYVPFGENLDAQSASPSAYSPFKPGGFSPAGEPASATAAGGGSSLGRAGGEEEEQQQPAGNTPVIVRTLRSGVILAGSSLAAGRRVATGLFAPAPPRRRPPGQGHGDEGGAGENARDGPRGRPDAKGSG